MLRTKHEAVSIPATWALVIAFAAIYFIWGSTYLAIRVAIETIPPFLMLGGRFAVAGALMYGGLRLRGRARPPGDNGERPCWLAGSCCVWGPGAWAGPSNTFRPAWPLCW
ncbi:MAG: hypothetical protein ACE5G0_07390 [Rhodothermales bacterium]